MNGNNNLNFIIMTKHLETFQVDKRKSEMSCIHIISVRGEKNKRGYFLLL